MNSFLEIKFQPTKIKQKIAPAYQIEKSLKDKIYILQKDVSSPTFTPSVGKRVKKPVERLIEQI